MVHRYIYIVMGSWFEISQQLADLASAKALIAFDSDVNKFNSSNRTPYDIAIQKCPAIADLLTGIGGTDSYQILADLQIRGSLGEDVDGTTQLELSFDRLLDPTVLDMDHGRVQGQGAEGQSAEDEGVVEEKKMPDIPEGTCT